MTTIATLVSLKGRRALVTDAAVGIGRVTAQTLAELGAYLILVDRLGTHYASLPQEIEEQWRSGVPAAYAALKGGFWTGVSSRALAAF